jgi:hypothetical protein
MLILAAGNALDHEALTLCQQFCEHFNDPAVYMAGACKWIADSAQN